ncbi:hypothetical protein CA983_35855 [Streptomyces swartbergensis]|uniref:Uncharacterized protein n=2 Tax=Streptomyces swartbergensis TaxID=487165 RepID=A0A243RIF6_9ACTN|nr:hypothetical protein CA983_35855 [Streptomyces swartbergensis]
MLYSIARRVAFQAHPTISVIRPHLGLRRTEDGPKLSAPVGRFGFTRRHFVTQYLPISSVTRSAAELVL